MAITATQVKELREKTGVGMMQCKKALVESGGDVAGAEMLLRKSGMAQAAKKSGRATGEGRVETYIHTGGKIGVMVEVNCETDFAARNEDFASLTRDIAMHIAAAGPRYLRREEVPAQILKDEQEIAREQAEKSGKPAAVIEKIVAGKIEKFYGENCLMDQAYVKDPDVTITQLLAQAVGRIGENLQIRRYVRFVLGEEV